MDYRIQNTFNSQRIIIHNIHVCLVAKHCQSQPPLITMARHCNSVTFLMPQLTYDPPFPDVLIG